MWARYIEIESEFVAQYLGELSKVEGNQSKAWVLLKDIQALSNRLSFQILKNVPVSRQRTTPAHAHPCKTCQAPFNLKL
jgi:hypothetical protein